MPKIITEATWLSVLRALHVAYGADEFTAKEVVESVHEDVLAAVEKLCSWQPRTPKRVASYFRENNGTALDSLRLVQVRKDRNGVAVWRVENEKA